MMEVREVESRYISLPAWLWKRFKRWKSRNEELMNIILVAIPMLMLIVGVVAIEDDKDYSFPEDWEAILIVVGGISLIIELVYVALKWAYNWATGLWNDYQQEVWR